MIVIDNKLCDRCGCCVAVCEADCITVYEALIEIDADKCTGCKKCVWICPKDALVYKDKDVLD
ncbi:MAG TPA: 4Fe-4S binding protein [Clostridiales bacterium]|nr:4Fe-4S binding protein [Clostridiales bacterium]HQP69422.1 4Fe-4S binding protein [Clostridiales bacterium]